MAESDVALAELLQRAQDALQEGRGREALDLLADAQRHLTDSAAPPDRFVAACRFLTGTALISVSRYGEAIDALEEAQLIYRPLGRMQELASCINNLGNAYASLGRYDDAIAAHQEARGLFAELGLLQDVASCDHNMGNVHQTRGHYAEAVSAYQAARSIYQQLDLRRDMADCEYGLANVHQAQAQYAKAASAFRATRAIYEQLGLSEDVADCDVNLGIVYALLSRHDEALVALQAARLVYVELDLVEGVAECDVNIGGVHDGMSRYDVAVEAYQAARVVYQRLGLDRELAHCDLGLGVAFMNLGRYDDALDTYTNARGIFQRLGLDRDVADCDVNLGNLCARLGRHGEALAAHRQARDVYERLGLARDAAVCTHNLGAVYESMSRYEEALAAHTAAQVVFERLSLERDAADCQANLGLIYEQLGRFDEALDAHQVARATYELLGLRREALDCAVNLGNTYAVLGRHEEARDTYRAAAPHYRQIGLEHEAADCTHNLGNAYHSLGFFDEALDAYQEARTTYQRLRLAGDVAGAGLGIANVQCSLERYEEAIAAYQAARATYEALGLERQVAGCDHNLGNVCRFQGRRGEAQAAYQAARSVFERLGLPLRVARCDLSIGQLLADSDSVGQAVDLVVPAMLTLDGVRHRIRSPALRHSWSAQLAVDYRQALSLAATPGGNIPQLEAELIETARAQGAPLAARSPLVPETPVDVGSTEETAEQALASLADRVEAAALEAVGDLAVAAPPWLAFPWGSRLRELAPANAGRTGTVMFATVAEELAGSTTWWWWGLWDTASAVHWCLIGHDGSLRTGQIPRRPLDPLLAYLDLSLPTRLAGETASSAVQRAFDGALAHRAPEQALAEELGRALIPSPLAELLDRGSRQQPVRLVIAPGPLLSRVPFDLLRLSDGRRLVEAATTSIGISAALADAALHLDRPVARCGAGLAIDPTPGLYGHHNPHHTKPPKELVANAAAHIGGHTNDPATRQALRDLLSRRPTQLLYVGHASLAAPDNPAAAALRLADGLFSARDWILHRDEFPAPPQVDLVACHSEGGHTPEYLGLAVAALVAGARRVTATRWALPTDQDTRGATTELAIHLFRARSCEAHRAFLLDRLDHWQADPGPATSPLVWAAPVQLQLQAAAGPVEVNGSRATATA